MSAETTSSQQPRLSVWLPVVAALIAIQAMVLARFGQPLFCTCGTFKLWTGAVLSAENSQQLTDWYTASHLLHGVLFYGLLHLIAPRLSIGARLAMAIGIEVTWEIIENTPYVINRYRQSALAQGYAGDSIVNSVSDTVAAGIGFAAARLLPVRLTIVLVVVIEVTLAYLIRDNLSLNIIQLVHPTEAISRWQAGRP